MEARDSSIIEFRPGIQPRTYRGSGSIDLGDVIADFALSLDELFASLNGR